MERERHQLVIALGEGAEGQRIKELLTQAAERAAQSLSSWARERLLVAAGIRRDGPADPLVQIHIDGNKITNLDLRAVAAMQVGWSHQVNALISGQWVMLGTHDPQALFERWSQVRRSAAF